MVGFTWATYLRALQLTPQEAWAPSLLLKGSHWFSQLYWVWSNYVSAQFCNSLHMAGSLFGKRLSSSNPQMCRSQLQKTFPGCHPGCFSHCPDTKWGIIIGLMFTEDLLTKSCQLINTLWVVKDGIHAFCYTWERKAPVGMERTAHYLNFLSFKGSTTFSAQGFNCTRVHCVAIMFSEIYKNERHKHYMHVYARACHLTWLQFWNSFICWLSL